MSINAYVGLQGHGKTYEVVESVMLPALAQGRRIVTNVHGLKLDKIKEYFRTQKNLEIAPVVVQIGNADLIGGKLLYHGGDGEQDTIVKPGDLVVIDECWRVWGTDSKISPADMIFFREHRHFVKADTGVACDPVVIAQAIEDLHRKLRVVVERTFVMTKVKELGLSKVYVVQQYQRGYIKRAALINTWRKTYSPTIYNLYESYAVKVGEASGTESIVDKRQNILADKSLWFWGFVLLVLGAGSIFYLYHFFHRGAHAQADTKSPIEATAPAGQGAIKGAAVGAAGPGASESRGGAWRLVGLYQTPSGLTAVLQGDGGRYRYVYDPPNVRQHSSDISVVLDGEPATPYTGGPSKSVIPGIAK